MLFIVVDLKVTGDERQQARIGDSVDLFFRLAKFPSITAGLGQCSVWPQLGSKSRKWY